MKSIRIKPTAFYGYTGEYKMLKDNSVHEIVEPPEYYKDKNLILSGVWVMGIKEPVRLLPHQFDYVSGIYKNEVVLELPF